MEFRTKSLYALAYLAGFHSSFLVRGIGIVYPRPDLKVLSSSPSENHAVHCGVDFPVSDWIL